MLMEASPLPKDSTPEPTEQAKGLHAADVEKSSCETRALNNGVSLIEVRERSGAKH